MPNYYPTYSSYYPSWNTNPYTAYSGMPMQSSTNYMINVDGEVGAKAWQLPNNLAPNTIIPLWDIDGKHVYFKSVDAYGRLNPMRKGTIVFEDEQVSESAGPDMSMYVTKDDLASIKNELLQEIRANKAVQSQSKTNQNGSK